MISVEELTSPWVDLWGMFLLCSVFPLSLRGTLDVFCPFFWLHTPMKVRNATNADSHTGAGKAVPIAAPSLHSSSVFRFHGASPSQQCSCGYFPVCSFYFESASWHCSFLPCQSGWYHLDLLSFFRDCSVSTSAISVSAVVKCCSSKLSPFSCKGSSCIIRYKGSDSSANVRRQIDALLWQKAQCIILHLLGIMWPWITESQIYCCRIECLRVYPASTPLF